MTVDGPDGATKGPASYICPTCGRLSHHPRDKQEMFCSSCGFEEIRKLKVKLAQARVQVAADQAYQALEDAIDALYELPPDQQVKYGLTLRKLLGLVAIVRSKS